MRKRADELPFTEILAMYSHALEMAGSFEEEAEDVEAGENVTTYREIATRWESYADELEKHIENRIKYALGKEDDKAPLYY